MRRALALGLLGFALAGCDDGGSSSDQGSGPSTTTTTAPKRVPETISLRVYFLRAGKVQPVSRVVTRTPAVAGASLLELFRGPSQRERSELGATSALPAGTRWRELSITDGVAHVAVDRDIGRAARAQLVYTLTQFPSVRAVELAGRRYTRRDFEAETPAILVESPLPFEHVATPLRATGTANTFEANFQYELYAPGGTKLAEHFVTATSGTGTRGTFEFTQQFAGARDGVGKLVVLERSAADGSRINVVELPIRM